MYNKINLINYVRRVSHQHNIEYFWCNIVTEYCNFLTSKDFSAERWPSIDLVVDNFKIGQHSHNGADAKNQFSYMSYWAQVFKIVL